MENRQKQLEKIKQLGVNVTWETYGVSPMVGGVQTAELVINSIGSTWIISILGVTLALFLIMGIFDSHRFYHINQEVALLIAHVLTLLLRSNYENRMTCSIVSATINYFFTVEASFFAMEGLHILSNCAGLIEEGSIMGMPTAMAAGWGGPLLYSTLVFGFFKDEHPSPFVCLINMHSKPIVCLLMFSFVGLHMLALIFVESSGMHLTDTTPLASTDQRISSLISSTGLTIILPLNLLHWFCTAYATHMQSIHMVGLVIVLNILLGVAIFGFHALSQPKIFNLLLRFWTLVKKWFTYRFKTE